MNNQEYKPLPGMKEAEGYPKTPRTMLRILQGLKKLREMYPEERNYMRKNPHVAGMAVPESEQVIINDYADLPEFAKHALYNLEDSRLHMWKSKNRPKYDLTPEQEEYFINDMKYSPDIQDVRETIASRIHVGDEGQPLASPQQVEYVRQMQDEMKKEKAMKKLANKMNQGKANVK